MKRALVVFLLCAILPALSQRPTSKYQVGSITAVNVHQVAPDNVATVADAYDISVRVGDIVYLVLYTPPAGTYGVRQAAGHDLLVLVETDTITFNDLLGRTSQVPIVHRERLPPVNDVVLTEAPATYYTRKFENLSRTLNLTEDQQAQLKPILEQEIGELGEVRGNPVLSFDAKVRKLETVVGQSDRKLKAILSAEQWQTLQNMRKQQRLELRKIAKAKKAK
jgi:hypothetical protein